MCDDMLSGFGFQVALDHVSLSNLWYDLNGMTVTRFYIFNKELLMSALQAPLDEKPVSLARRISDNFMDVTNSMAFVMVATSLGVIDETLKNEDKYVIYQTNRPYSNRFELSASEILNKLREETCTEFDYEFSHVESGSWKKMSTLTVFMPSDVTFKDGATVYLYDMFDFKILKSKLNFRGDGPERLSIIDGHFCPTVRLGDTTLKFTSCTGAGTLIPNRLTP